MIRAGAGILAGLLVGALLIALAQSAGHALFPPAHGDAHASIAMRRIIQDVPPGAMIVELFGWAIGVFGGAVLARWIAQGARAPAYAIGGLLFAINAWTMALLPHPWWMWAGAALFIVAAALAAGRLPLKRSD